MTDLTFSCRCGTLHGRLRDVSPAVGTHLVCYCGDCRAYAHHLGDESSLDAAGGTEIFQTSAGRIEIDAGQDRIACLRMSPRGPVRWYASCCGSALANTPPTAGIPFAGVIGARLSGEREALGPLVAHVFVDSAVPEDGVTPRKFGVRQVLVRFLRIVLAARMAGDHRRHAFFPEARPLALPAKLTPEERRAAYR